MITFLYSIYDEKAENYSKPFHSITNAAALRDVKNAMSKDVLHPPEDYSLFKVGTFNDSTSEIIYEKEKIVDLSTIAE